MAKSSGDQIQRVPETLQHGGSLLGRTIPFAFSQWLRLSALRLPGVLSHSCQKNLSVQTLPQANLCDSRNSRVPTHLPLTTWFWAIYLCANDKRGISAVQLSILLEICFESTWNMLRKLRSAMGQRDANCILTGIRLADGPGPAVGKSA